MTRRIRETNKARGVCYAFTDDGLELPVIDITHPAFLEANKPSTIEAAIERTVAAFAQVEGWPREAIQALGEKSILTRGTLTAAGGVMSGMVTYLHKLPPNMLGEGYASDIDRRIAAGVAPLSMRLRLRHVSQMIANSLAPLLLRRHGPLHMLNVAGGTAIDSINALLLLWKGHRERLDGRQVVIHVLDSDRGAVHFGTRALEALVTTGGPLWRLNARLDYIHYDWSDTAPMLALLESIREPDAVMCGSSEGGLFEYPSDEDITGNLAVMHELTPPDFPFIGTVVRNSSSLDARLANMEAMKGRPAIRFLGVNAFRTLAGKAGWHIAAACDEIIHSTVALTKTS